MAEKTEKGWPESSRRPPANPPGTLSAGAADDEAVRAARLANRSPITMWDFAVWAYRREKVRFLCGDGDVAVLAGGESGYALAARYVMSSDAPLAKSWHFAPAAHEDALALHGLVTRLALEDFWLVVNAAERATLPPWFVPEPTWRMVPVWRKKGKPQHLYGKGNQPVACLVRCVGEIDGFDPVGSFDDYARLCELVRRRYRRFVALLTGLMAVDALLSRWRIDGLGVDPEPWARAPQIGS